MHSVENLSQMRKIPESCDFDEITLMDGSIKSESTQQIDRTSRRSRRSNYFPSRFNASNRRKSRGVCRTGQPIVICALSSIIMLLIILIAVLSRTCEPVGSGRKQISDVPDHFPTFPPINKKLHSDCPLDFPWNGIRLPTYATPVHYQLIMRPNLTTFTFRGFVDITIQTISSSSIFVLHAKDLAIESYDIRTDGWYADRKSQVKISKLTLCDRQEQMALRLTGRTKANRRYNISISFHGNLTDDLIGLYRSQYKTSSGVKRYMAVTQFEPTDARAAFPCFDEPSYKATFSVSIIRESAYKSLANMPFSGYENYTEFREKILRETDSFSPAFVEFMRNEKPENLIIDYFLPSLNMSTYLVAMAVFDFPSIYNYTKSGVKVAVYAPEPQINQTEFALSIAVDSLNWLESFFKVSYPLPKQALVAVADFITGAMENWGMVTFRDRYLLYDPKESSFRSKHIIAEVIMHELSHQWFGNLVTMKWWNELWLNEGFATFIEDYGVSKIRPEWSSMSQWYADVVCNAMASDGLATSHSISADIDDPHDIQAMFDEISYDKSASMIYMLMQLMGEEKLRVGLQEYLEEFKFRNAASEDLWAKLEKQMPTLPSFQGTHLPLHDVMNSWTNQVGYPYIRLSMEDGVVEVQQFRFLYLTSEREKPESVNARWYIPLSIMTNNNKDAMSLVWLTQTTKKVLKFNTTGVTWLKANTEQSGFYRTMYALSNWEMLTKQLISNHTVIGRTDRAGILNDAFSFVKAGLLPVNYSLELVKYLPSDEAEAPWDVALSHLKYIESLLDDTEIYLLFRDFVRSLLTPVYKKIGWTLMNDHQKRLLQVQILTLSCHFNVLDCVDRARTIFENWMKTNESLTPDLRYLVCSVGITHGTKRHWSYVYMEYLTTSFYPGEREDYLVSLFSTQDPWLIWRFDADLRLAIYTSVTRSESLTEQQWAHLYERYRDSDYPEDKALALAALGDVVVGNYSERLLDMILDPQKIRPRDIPLVFSRLGVNPVAKFITWRFIQSNWNRLVEILGITTNLIGELLKKALSGFKTEFDLKEMTKFFNERDLGSNAQAVEQLIEIIKINIQWIKLNYDPLAGWLNEWNVNKEDTVRPPAPAVGNITLI